MSPMRGTGGVVFLSSIAIFSYLLFNSYTSRARRRHIRKGLVGSIGNTPLIRISSLSHATGCEILGKAEFLNPGGSVKDRVALKIIQEVTYYFKITTYYYSLSQKYHLLYFYNAIFMCKVTNICMIKFASSTLVVVSKIRVDFKIIYKRGHLITIHSHKNTIFYIKPVVFAMLYKMLYSCVK